MLARIDALNADIAELEDHIEEMVAPFATAVGRLDETPVSARSRRARRSPKSGWI